MTILKQPSAQGRALLTRVAQLDCANEEEVRSVMQRAGKREDFATALIPKAVPLEEMRRLYALVQEAIQTIYHQQTVSREVLSWLNADPPPMRQRRRELLVRLVVRSEGCLDNAAETHVPLAHLQLQSSRAYPPLTIAQELRALLYFVIEKAMRGVMHLGECQECNKIFFKRIVRRAQYCSRRCAQRAGARRRRETAQ